MGLGGRPGRIFQISMGGVCVPAAILTLATAAVPITMAAAQRADKGSGYDRAARATVLHVTNVYANADTDAPPIDTVTPGHEVVVLARNGAWVRVLANTDSNEADEDDNAPTFHDSKTDHDPLTGWVRDKGIVSASTPNGDAVLFGAAANLEAQAEEPHAPKDAAAEAHLLYRRASEYFPQSPRAAEAAFRSADIRWQLDAADNSTLPSAREQEAYLRPQIFEGELRRVMKLYPDSPFAARAAYVLLGNKVCGDWQGLPKCPEMEAALYEKYAERYPGGPDSAKALYEAAYREGAVVTMYTENDDTKRADAAVKRCAALAATMTAKYPQSDYTARAQAVAYKVAQGIPLSGSDRE